ncbi:MAG: glutamate synthase subunit beta [Alphaproteobacteria bacterium]|nr:glutamate synthase subunit beta [Alphaproteobacteria bacterium]
MGKPTGFMEIKRGSPGYAPVSDRIQHWREFLLPLDSQDCSKQGSRCMDCGTPYCHNGCPVMNIIPDWNDLVYKGRWKEALEVLHSTNNFPEFTGRVCPAPCEAACTLNLIDESVTIKHIEYSIVEKGWSEGWIRPLVPPRRSGKRVAVVGSGPAGLACAQQLARAGHAVTVYEKNARVGGLLRYGIPNFKLEKWVIDRRMAQLQAEGVEFKVNRGVGRDVPAGELLERFDAVVLAIGSEHPRDLPVAGRELAGVHFAMDFLSRQNRRVGDEPQSGPDLTARGKHVVVIGGGDTGSDCVGTSIRQGALKVTQIEIMPRPPEREDKLATWPNWPHKLVTSTSHQEGCERRWSIGTRSLSGRDGRVQALHATQVDGKMQPIAGTEFDIKADLVLLAMGFVHPVREGMLADLGVKLDGRGNVEADTTTYQSSVGNVFACGDTRRGQSLVVWAIREGRQTARAVDAFLTGSSQLPR